MPITPKEKKIIINKQINDILKDNFSGNVSTLSLQKVESLYNEGSISNKAYRFLKDVIKYQKQEECYAHKQDQKKWKTFIDGCMTT